jgi:hypothetical protein
MAVNWLEVPENETFPARVFPPSGHCLVSVREAARAGLERAQNGPFTGPIRGLGGVEKVGFSWYNFNSRQTNLSIRYFNHLKSIRGRSPEAGLGRVFRLVFEVWPAQC